jgi:hypothetical protein
MANEIQEFMDELLAQANLTNLPPAFRERFVDQLEQELTQRLGLIAMDALPENQWEGFDQALATEDAKVVYQFLNSHIPDLKKRLLKACEDFAKDFLGKTGKLQKDLGTVS